MSRGGRAGFRGGRGGGPQLSFEDRDLKPKTDPMELYPEANIPLQASLSPVERLQNRLQKEIVAEIQSIFRPPQTAVDIKNDGIQRYSDRHLARYKIWSLKELPLDERYFPEELHSVFVSSKKRVIKKSRTIDIQTFLDLTVQETEENNVEIAEGEGAEEEEEANADQDEEFGADEENDYGDNYFDNGEGDDDFGDDGGGDDYCD
ncbi:DNA-directed RNA polymerase III subunit rpc31 [Neolecta irregularis DAH-3]|uniref:DNA-directed RNA polymerase III subunit n=1 Tax=Neolecta irregularis (strain DAH-3) TaxID=1198029 RepID=A0A1U7LTK4_NEOID|nr:DNA-directed RNA polymerase III subunit rpc31 [Neolecta irregularis DAH-3]|eukprot:OLL25974.1 DNA-directed RNA polymerase III subunit rpc31 [Neolecta irregularis DAH-3]